MFEDMFYDVNFEHLGEVVFIAYTYIGEYKFSVKLTAKEFAGLRYNHGRFSDPQSYSVMVLGQVLKPHIVGATSLISRFGMKIEAIKFLRAETGLGLKEAKSLIELLDKI